MPFFFFLHGGYILTTNKRHDRSSVSNLSEHIVFTTKFRGKVLKGRVATECEKAIREICDNMDIEIISIAIQPEHTHVQIQHPPKLSISEIVEKLKSNSSKHLRRKFPHLKKWCKKALWSRGYHAESVGHGKDVVRKYIQDQSNHASSGFTESVGQLPNAVAKPDDTYKQEGN